MARIVVVADALDTAGETMLLLDASDTPGVPVSTTKIFIEGPSECSVSMLSRGLKAGLLRPPSSGRLSVSPDVGIVALAASES
jgi:hypothetical protein